VRSAFPADRAVTMRVSGTDWADGGWDIDQTIAFGETNASRRSNRAASLSTSDK
jgi:2,4-dienoyl-CoA reductase-like NADH-dependent reductase (Old Yellow Enzyme family)